MSHDHHHHHHDHNHDHDHGPSAEGDAKQLKHHWPVVIIVAVVGALKVFNSSAETLFWAFLLWPIRYVFEK